LWQQTGSSFFPQRSPHVPGGGSVFSMDCDFRGWPLLISNIRHTETCPEDHFRFAAATVENAWNRLAVCRTIGVHRKKHTVQWTALNRHMSFRVGKPLKMTWPTSLDFIVWGLMPTDIFSGRFIGVLGYSHFDRFPPWRQQTGRWILEWFPVRHTCFSMDCGCLRLAQLDKVCLQDGGSKPAEVYRCKILRRKRGFFIDLNSPRLLQRGSIKNLDERR